MQDLQIFTQVFIFIRYAVVAVVLAVILAMALRLLFNYLDPNPFGTVGRFSHWLKKQTDFLVESSASALGRGGFDTRLAPLVSILGIIVFAYFGLQLVGDVAFTLDGILLAATDGKFVKVIGYLLYGVLAVFSLFIIMRVIFSWFLNPINPLQAFLIRVTNPIMVPFQRIIPPLGMFDISPIIVIFLLNFLKTAVLGVLVNS
ncbi:MAG: YggT family protein [Pyrinomonadaceae bacterium]|nr:YggT family protein [Pyrinomonadaceae bacterium]